MERDSLTGLYAKEFFYRRVEKYLKENPGGDYLMWVTDIDEAVRELGYKAEYDLKRGVKETVEWYKENYWI